ncbi:putative ADP-L-glycero-D-manno-heptose-6-epimerase [Waddlia chondrophila 2032/99]|nr:NAD-dependent epimerase/dehydratase family protein [Waddlia chondrophila]CCB91422.1 putative ADP-L-glycero-D-manno-heptose-6-epimerase [Waddlia chondrophila 2032/99]
MKGKILVTGGAGVIGRPLVGKLLQNGAELSVIDLAERPKEWPKEVCYLQTDINQLDKDQLLKINPDYCFHLAASFERSEESPEFFQKNFYNNILLSHALLYHLQRCDCLKKIIFASSYLVYNPEDYFFKTPPKKRVNLSEVSSLSPRNLCGNAKLLHENELNFISRHSSFKAVSARIFRVYGKGSHDIISRWTRLLIAGKAIKIYGKESVFDYIYADDVAEGLIRLAESEIEGVVNLGTGKSRRVAEVLAILKEHFPEMDVEDEEHSSLYEASQACMEEFVKAVKWRPTTTLEKGIPKIIAYEKTTGLK